MNHNRISKKRLKYIKKKKSRKNNKIGGSFFKSKKYKITKDTLSKINILRCHGNLIPKQFHLPEKYNIITLVGSNRTLSGDIRLRIMLYKYLYEINFDVKQMFNCTLLSGNTYNYDNYSDKTKEVCFNMNKIILELKKNIPKIKGELMKKQLRDSIDQRKDRIQTIKNLDSIGYIEFKLRMGGNRDLTPYDALVNGIDSIPMMVNDNNIHFSNNEEDIYGICEPQELGKKEEIEQLNTDPNLMITHMKKIKGPEITTLEAFINGGDYGQGTYLFRFCRLINEDMTEEQEEAVRVISGDSPGTKNIINYDCDFDEGEKCNEESTYLCPGCSKFFCQEHYTRHIMQIKTGNADCGFLCHKCNYLGFENPGEYKCIDECCKDANFKNFCKAHFAEHKL